MDADRIIFLEEWAHRLRMELPLGEVIESIKARMHGANEDDQYQLTLMLKNFMIEAGRELEADRLIDEVIARLPADVRFPIAKASLQLYFLKQPRDALDSINEALRRAHQTGFFRREALGMKARVLLDLGFGRQLTQTLEEIMSLEMRQGIPDIGPERDFVDRAPRGMVPEEVLARYDIFCPRRDSG